MGVAPIVPSNGTAAFFAPVESRTVRGIALRSAPNLTMPLPAGSPTRVSDSFLVRVIVVLMVSPRMVVHGPPGATSKTSAARQALPLQRTLRGTTDNDP